MSENNTNASPELELDTVAENTAPETLTGVAEDTSAVAVTAENGDEPSLESAPAVADGVTDGATFEVAPEDPPENTEGATDAPVQTAEGATYETPAEESTASAEAEKKKEPKKKRSVKEFFLYLQNHVFTTKVCNIIMLCLGITITVLCALQLGLLGLEIASSYESYLNAIRTGNYISIALMLITLMFMIVLLVNVIKAIVSVSKKGHEVRFEAVTTIIAFGLFSGFMSELFGGRASVTSGFGLGPVALVILILVLLYAIIRLFLKDFGERIAPFSFSLGAIVVCIVMFTQGVGNFATFTVDGLELAPASAINVYEYLDLANVALTTDAQMLPLDFEMTLIGEAEQMISIAGYDFDITLFIMLLELTMIFCAKIMPYAAISLVGYLIYGLVSRNYMQYYNLQACKKVSILMLVVSILSALSTVGLFFICNSAGLSLGVKMNYVNMAVTVVLCIVMIVLTSLPWKLFVSAYNRRYEEFKKSEGGN